MKNKGVFIARLFYMVIVTAFLFFLFFKSSDIITKLILSPFLICSLAKGLENIFLIANKKDYAIICSKLYVVVFLIFWFGFLLYWCYFNFINKNYMLFFFSLPFWMVGIYIAYKFFMKKKKIHSTKINSFNFKIIISAFLVIVCLLAGLIMLFWGIRNTYKTYKITKNYNTIEGYFYKYDIYSNNQEEVTYKLIYRYVVNNQEYTISTDYGTNYKPQENSVRMIKYNPDNPEEAVFTGTNSNIMLLLMGLFFTFGSFTFILAVLSIKGYFEKFRIDVIGIYIGAFMLLTGIGIILFQIGTTISLTALIKSFGIWLSIPVLFIIVGIFQIIKCILSSNNISIKKSKKM